MKKLILKLLIIVSVLGLISGCGSQKKVVETVYGSMYGKTYVYTERQVDSMCVADTLPNIEEWLSSSFTDYETGKRVTKRMYYKSLEEDSQMIYILLPYEEKYKITKRVTKPE